MRCNGSAGRLMRARGGSKAHLFVLGDLAFAGRALDDAGFDASIADAAVNLVDIDRRDVVDAPLLEVGGVAEVADFLEALDAIFECGLALEFRRGAIELPSGPAYQQMLMHEGGAELFG